MTKFFSGDKYHISFTSGKRRRRWLTACAVPVGPIKGTACKAGVRLIVGDGGRSPVLNAKQIRMLSRWLQEQADEIERTAQPYGEGQSYATP